MKVSLPNLFQKADLTCQVPSNMQIRFGASAKKGLVLRASLEDAAHGVVIVQPPEDDIGPVIGFLLLRVLQRFAQDFGF